MRYLTLVFVLFSTLGHALACGEFEGWVRALYWTPTSTTIDSLFVNRSPSNSFFNLEQFSFDFDYDWGVELGGGWRWRDCSDVQLRGLWVRNTRDVDTRVEPQSGITTSIGTSQFVVFVSNGFGLVSTRLRSQYWTIRATLDQIVASHQCLSFAASIGARYVNLSQALRITTSLFDIGLSTQVSSNDLLSYDFSGGGIEAGLHAIWNLWWGLSLSGEVGGTATIGTTKTQQRVFVVINAESTLNTFLRRPSKTIIVPGVDVALDLAYSTCCYGAKLTGSVGYALQHYFEVYRDASSTLTSRFYDAGNAGPYLSPGAQY